MASISGSGLDVSSIVSSLMSLEQEPLDALNSKKSTYSSKSTVLSDFRSELTTLRTTLRNLADAITDPFKAKTVATSDNSVATATTTSKAIASQHTISVQQLAKNHTMLSNTVVASDTSLASALGEGEKVFSVTINGTATEVTVDVAAGDTNEEIMRNVASALNDAFDAVEYDEEEEEDEESNRVNASYVADTSSTGKLVFTSKLTGLENKMQLADVSGGLLAALGIDNESVAYNESSGTGGYLYEDSKLDAKIVFNGISITRASNEIDDVVDGLTINLVNTQDSEDTAVSLTVKADYDSIKASVESFISAYNKTLSYVRAKTEVTSDSRGILADNLTFRSLTSDLRAAVTSAVSGSAAAGFKQLSEIGITTDSNGALTISDSSALQKAISSKSEAVSSLFRGTGGVLERMQSLLSPFLGADGYIDSSVRTNGSQITAVDEAIERMETRLEKRRTFLTQQYTRLNEVISSYNSTVSMVQQIQSYLS